jgi:hypothetical protein
MHSFPDLLASSAFVGIQETGCPDAEAAALLIFRYGRHTARNAAVSLAHQKH